MASIPFTVPPPPREAAVSSGLSVTSSPELRQAWQTQPQLWKHGVAGELSNHHSCLNWLPPPVPALRPQRADAVILCWLPPCGLCSQVHDTCKRPPEYEHLFYSWYLELVSPHTPAGQRAPTYVTLWNLGLGNKLGSLTRTHTNC